MNIWLLEQIKKFNMVILVKIERFQIKPNVINLKSTLSGTSQKYSNNINISKRQSKAPVCCGWPGVSYCFLCHLHNAIKKWYTYIKCLLLSKIYRSFIVLYWCRLLQLCTPPRHFYSHLSKRHILDGKVAIKANMVYIIAIVHFFCIE